MQNQVSYGENGLFYYSLKGAHKYIFTYVGVFLVLALVSGVVPPPSFPPCCTSRPRGSLTHAPTVGAPSAVNRVRRDRDCAAALVSVLSVCLCGCLSVCLLARGLLLIV